MENTDKKLVINKDMTVGEVIMLKPSTISILMGIGLGCIGCPASQNETIEEAAMVHGLDTQSLVDALNR